MAISDGGGLKRGSITWVHCIFLLGCWISRSEWWYRIILSNPTPESRLSTIHFDWLMEN